MINEDRNTPTEIVDQIMSGDHLPDLIEHASKGDFACEAICILMDSMRKPCDSKKVLEELQLLMEGEIEAFAEEFYG